MQFTTDQINLFKDLYKNKYQIELSDSDAIEQITKLIDLVKTIYRPITIDDYLETKLTQIKLYENRKREMYG